MEDSRMRSFVWVLTGICILGFLIAPLPALAENSGFEGLALGVGANRAAENMANENTAFGIKWRERHFEYGLDFIQAGAVGYGYGNSNCAFLWASWLEEFDRPGWQDYGIYVGAGAGTILGEDEFVDWQAGPFIILGWDFTARAGLEGKLGYFGENIFGTAMIYWYFQ
jgi:hypothetical protein